MKGEGYGVVCGTVCSVGKLQGVQRVRESGWEEVMYDLTNSAKHFMMMEVSATGR